MKAYFLLLVFFLVDGYVLSPTPSVVSSHNLVEGFEVMEGFKIERVATEPLIQDPVAMEVDEQGRLFVVEMPGYPLDLSKSGRIKLLKDSDHDGYPDQAVVFADSLTLPTGIMRWKKGFVVTDAPDVLYLEDTNGDDRADIRQVLLTGFARSNPQHNLNTPVLGLDNWIYLAHENKVTPFVYQKEFGDEGAEIRFPDHPTAPKLVKNANGRNVRFRPDTHELEELSANTQYGQTFDAWGHHLLTSNADHLFQEVLPARYAKRNPHLLIGSTSQDISDHGNAAEIYPTTQNPNHQLLTDVGVITSSCGVTWYLGGAFGEKFNHVTFIAEPVHNLVHADVIKDQGASFVASRLLEKKEFLTSKDPWFRPVQFYIGPEGALYVIDYYRQNIEHPEWMSDEMTQAGTLYNGKDKGRIYRIVPEGGLPMNWLNRLKINEQDDTQLIAQSLDQPNIWHRRTAQRLLSERYSVGTNVQKNSLVAKLQTLLTNARYAEAKVHALWLLERFGGLTEAHLAACLQDTNEGVKENAIKVAETMLLQSGVTNASSSLTNLLTGTYGGNKLDKLLAKVRFQLLATLGYLHTPEAEALKMRILEKDIEDKWIGIAAISGASGHEAQLFEAATKAFGRMHSSAKETFFATLASTIVNTSQWSDTERLLNTLLPANISTNDPATAWYKAAALRGVWQYWQRKGLKNSVSEVHKERLLGLFTHPSASELPKVAVDVLEMAGLPKQSAPATTLAKQWLNDPRQPVSLRVASLRLLTLQNPNISPSFLEKIIVSSDPESLRLAAFASLAKISAGQVCRFSLAQWSHLSPMLKQEAVAQFLRTPSQIKLLLQAIETRTVLTSDLAWPQQVRLMNYYNADIRQMARKVLSFNEDRKAVVQQYSAILETQGNKTEGKKVYQQVCSSCHQVGQNEGVAFGPDLASLRSRNSLSILTEILHPNHSIADGYDYYTVTYQNGKQVAGIIKSENNASLTLVQMGGDELILARTEVKSIEKSPVSIMPNGFENSISKQQMADLIAFIKNQ